MSKFMPPSQPKEKQNGKYNFFLQKYNFLNFLPHSLDPAPFPLDYVDLEKWKRFHKYLRQDDPPFFITKAKEKIFVCLS
jgi:hypothetical protein